MILFKVKQKLWEIFELGNCICKMHKTNGVHKVSCFSSFLWGVFEMLITWSKMGCWRWDDNGREAQLCGSLAEGSQEGRAIYSLSTLVTAPGRVSILGVSAGVARSCWEHPEPGEVGAEEGLWAELRGCRRCLQDVETTAPISLGKPPQTTGTQPRGTAWTSLTFAPLVVICEPSNALGLFCKNFLVKPLSSRALILLG